MTSHSIFRHALFILTILCFAHSLIAQEIPQCGTVATPESEQFIQDLMPKINQYEQTFYQLSSQRSSTAVSSVPIKAHIIRTDGGFGGLTETQVANAIADMNLYYANAYLEFFLCDGINFIDSSEYYDFSTDEQDALTLANNVTNVINIYFANTVSTEEGAGLCGYAYFPGGPEVIMMNNSCALNGSTLPHEMGHFFALSHTHGNSNSSLTTELVDGSNCASSGDFICDTPADPQLSNSNVNASCNYVGSATDANGDFFNPNPLNIMSYSRKSCRTEFSPQQYARIYAVYQASRSELNCPSFNVDIASNYTRDCSNVLDVDFVDNSTGATSWQWDVDGDDVIDYTTQNPTHSYTSTGTFDVTLTISNGTDNITKVYQNYIEVGSENIATSELVLTLTTDDWPAETSWVLRDSNGTPLYTSPTYVEGVDDFQTFTENFAIATNECYSFEMIDSYGDGICCASGFGSYNLSTLEGNVIVSGGNYGSGETTYMANDVLSVDNYFKTNSISLYPNPSYQQLNIQSSNMNDLPDGYHIYNVLGQEITSKEINNVSDLTINTTPLNSGVYYIRLNKRNHSETLSFIKN
ncbi:T9SS type A sorting domain-containing protein [Psychroserpens sp. BH13MA-6]